MPPPRKARSAPVEAALADPKVQEALAFLKEIVLGRGLFLRRSKALDFVDLYQRVLGVVRYGPLTLQLGGRSSELPPDKIQAALMLSALAENADALKVPNVMWVSRSKTRKRRRNNWTNWKSRSASCSSRNRNGKGV